MFQVVNANVVNSMINNHNTFDNSADWSRENPRSNNVSRAYPFNIYTYCLHDGDIKMSSQLHSLKLILIDKF